MNLDNKIKNIRNHMRVDAGVGGDAQRIEQLSWMLFCKFFDSMEEVFSVTEENYKISIPEEILWRNWASDPEGITGDELVDFIENKLFKEVNNINVNSYDNPRALIFNNAMSGINNYMKNGIQIRKVLNEIESINFNSNDDRHTFGDIYESFLSELQSAGDAGEHYTPRAITKLIVNRLKPQINEKILDPACGTGGFLVDALEFIKENKEYNSLNDIPLLQENFQGYEKKQFPHLLCVTNLMLHGLDLPKKIFHDNTLEKPLRDWDRSDEVDIVVANPPWGGTEVDGTELNFPSDLRSKETADLFMCLFIKLLKENGRAGVVLPDGFLFGIGNKSNIKKKLLEECNLHTIIKLPISTFAPYSSVNQTFILFFNKGKSTNEIFFYEHNLPKNYKAYSKTKPIRYEEFKELISWWDSADDLASRKITENSWKVTIKDIVENNYNLDIPNPNKKEGVQEKVEDLITSFDSLKEEIDLLTNKMFKDFKSFSPDYLNNNSEKALQNIIDSSEKFRNEYIGVDLYNFFVLDSIFNASKLTGNNLKPLDDVIELLKGSKPEITITKNSNSAPYLEAKYIRGLKEPQFGILNSNKSIEIKKEDLIIITDGSNSGEVFEGVEGILASTMCKINYSKELDRDYLKLFFKYYKETFYKDKKGSKIPHLKKELLQKIKIPITHIDEQQKVVKNMSILLDHSNNLSNLIKERLEIGEKLNLKLKE